MNTLEQWKVEAEEALYIIRRRNLGEYEEDEKRILALIELIRKKDEILLKMRNYSHSEHCKTEDQCCDGIENCSCSLKDCAESLALTEQLK